MAKKKSVFDRVPQRPVQIEHLNAKALELLQQGQFGAGADLLSQSLAINPRQPEANYNFGYALQQLGLFDSSIQAYGQTIALSCHDVEALMARGHLYATLKRYPEALGDLARVAQLVPNHPDAWNNLGNVLLELKREPEAIEAYEKALALRPAYPQALFNKGKALYELERYTEAGNAYEQAYKLDPSYSEAQWHLSWIRLSQGDFERGWRDYEARWDVAALNYARRHTSKPLWTGETSLIDKTILLYAEQGLGDTLQFCRYAPLLMQAGAKVLLEVPESLVRLLTSLPADVAIYKMGDMLPGFDVQCPLMSLPLAFGTRLDSVPTQVPYLFANAEDVAIWEESFRSPQPGKPRIGLVWSGSTGHKNDENRSMSLDQLAPLFNMDIEFVCLQPEIRQGDEGWLAAHSEVKLPRFSLRDFADTAALVENLDLVISVDTSVAHLAGALGKPVWIIVSSDPDFRWLLEREDSPWYPTARLFRQRERGNWAEVVSRVVSELKTFSEARTDTSK